MSSNSDDEDDVACMRSNLLVVCELACSKSVEPMMPPISPPMGCEDLGPLQSSTSAVVGCEADALEALLLHGNQGRSCRTPSHSGCSVQIVLRHFRGYRAVLSKLRRGILSGASRTWVLLSPSLRLRPILGGD